MLIMKKKKLNTSIKGNTKNKDILALIINSLKYQLAFEMLARSYAQKFMIHEDLFQEVNTNSLEYWSSEVRERFLNDAKDKMIEIINEVYKDK